MKSIGARLHVTRRRLVIFRGRDIPLKRGVEFFVGESGGTIAGSWRRLLAWQMQEVIEGAAHKCSGSNED
jgi:hypothetical protein